MSQLIEATHLTIDYGEASQPIIQDASFSIASNEIFVLVGPSGCGKSTLLRSVAGFIPYAGTLLMNGEPVVGADWQRGVVFQNASLYPWLTVAQNVGFGLKARKFDSAIVQEKTTALLTEIGLTKQAQRYPYELSGGMRQRVAIARVLANQPPLMLMDEPFGALDAFTRAKMQQLVLALWQHNHQSILLITHDLNEAIRLGSRIAVMSATSKRIIRTLPNPCQGFDSDALHVEADQARFDALHEQLRNLINQR